MGPRHLYLLPTAALLLVASARAEIPAPPPPLPLRIQVQFILPDDTPRPAPPLPIVNDGFLNDQDIPGPLTALVNDLRSPNFPDRQTATRTLLRLPPSRLPEIVATLAAESDSEAIARLTQVAAHLYLKPRTSLRMQNTFLGFYFRQPNPLASTCMLGMKFKTEVARLRPSDREPTVSVVVAELQPGFPAMQTLLNGDRILALDGKPFPPDLPDDDRSYFPTLVTGLWPRQSVPLTLLRDGQTLTLTVQLAGMPGTGTLSLAAQVDRRSTELATFLASLKTAEKPQAARP
jgi:hypothetical protein